MASALCWIFNVVEGSFNGCFRRNHSGKVQIWGLKLVTMGLKFFKQSGRKIFNQSEIQITYNIVTYQSLTFEYKPLYLALMTCLFKGGSGFGFFIAKNHWLFSHWIGMVSGFLKNERDQIIFSHVASSGFRIQLLSREFGQTSSDHFRRMKVNVHRWICYDQANGRD